MCVTIVSTYVLLNFEEHRWQWPAFVSGGSVSFFVMLYSVYYYFAKTAMTGLLQLSFYFVYMMALRCGAVRCGDGLID